MRSFAIMSLSNKNDNISISAAINFLKVHRIEYKIASKSRQSNQLLLLLLHPYIFITALVVLTISASVERVRIGTKTV